jgi:hypothetical protein
MELALSGLSFFDSRGATAGRSEAASRVRDKAPREKRLFCAFCGHLITHQDERIEVNGRHEHRCTNPAGFTFSIGCFHEAGGCIATGAASEAHTWFKGYAWKVAVCARCARHLGWRFESTTDFFHGLILDRLTSGGGASHQRGR